MENDDIIVADAFVMADPPVVAEAFVERQPPAVEIKVEPKPIMPLTAPVMAEDLVEPPPPTMETKVEPKPTQLAALNPHVRLLDEPDQPASRGYIMYANLPTDWTPVPLPAGISSASTPHTDNIRAEIEQAAKLFDVDIQMMKAFARIEIGPIRKRRPAHTSACSSFPTRSLPNIGTATSTTSATARSRRRESLRLRPHSSRTTSVVGLRRQNSTASTSKAMKAVRFITTRRSSWRGRTCI